MTNFGMNSAWLYGVVNTYLKMQVVYIEGMKPLVLVWVCIVSTFNKGSAVYLGRVCVRIYKTYTNV